MSSRYMEQNCEPWNYRDWDKFPIQLCKYTVSDKNRTTKTAQVILLDATPEKLALWVLSTCKNVKGSTEASCTDKLSRQIINQSGAQFPVAGIVFEDILPEDGINEIYCFRNGVTVKIGGVPHRGTLQPSQQEQELCINGAVSKTLKFARIAGTSREEFIANGGAEDVAGNKWNEVIKKLYQGAFNSDVNELLVAWAKKNL